MIQKPENFPDFDISNHNRHYANYKALRKVYLFIKKQVSDKERERSRKEMEERDAENEKLRQLRQQEFEEKERERHQLILERNRSNLSKLKQHILFEIDNNNSRNIAGIYLICCEESSSFYIGSTQNLHNRKSDHLSMLKNQKHHSIYMQKEFNKYGESSFNFYALKFCDNYLSEFKGRIGKEIRVALKNHEQWYLDNYKPNLNYEHDSFGKRHWYLE